MTRAQVMVLCAGQGSRLGMLTREIPKPLLPIGDRPQLEHLFDWLSAQGLCKVVINTHHLAHRFGELDARGLTLEIVHEPDLRGTAGALAFARDRLCAPLVVWNGDILANPELGPLLESVESGGITLLAHPPAAGTSGSLGLDSAGRVVRLRGEGFGAEAQAADYIGVLALGADALERVPERGCLVADLFLPWLRDGRSISTLPHPGSWTDMGSLTEYQRANLDWLSRMGRSFHVADGARVAPTVALEQSIVHREAMVSGEGRLERCIVCTGAQALAPLSDAVVLPSGEVVPLSSG